MSSSRLPDGAFSGGTYGGFSALGRAAAFHATGPETPPDRSRRTFPLALVTAAASAALALLLGYSAQNARPAAPLHTAPPAAAPPDIAEPSAAAPPAPSGPDLARAPAPRLVVHTRPARLTAQPRHDRSASLGTPVRPAFHCDWRLRRSERMICEDPALARLDRELNHSYGMAIRAGVSRPLLRQTQDRWVMRRESEARSPRELAQYYRRRIAELRAMSEARPRRSRRR